MLKAERDSGKGGKGVRGKEVEELTASKNKHRPRKIIHHRQTPQRKQLPHRNRLLGHLPREPELRIKEARQEE